MAGAQSKFTDIFIRRPVLATVVSLTILVLGLRSAGLLPVLQYPYTQNAVVTVTTVYPGADAALVASFITTPLENAISQANGIDYMTSSSVQGVSTISVNLLLNYKPDDALVEINTKVNSVLNQLPPQSQLPQLSVAIGQTTSAIYLGFYSNVLEPNQITDYLIRSVQPRLQAVEGVQTAQMFGGKNFALRAWLDPHKLAAYGLTADDVRSALAANNYLSSAGHSKGQMVQINLKATTDLKSLDGFRDMVVKSVAGRVVRLEDVAEVTLGSEDYDSLMASTGRQSIGIAIDVAPGANLLEVVRKVRQLFPDIQAQLPQGITAAITYDSAKFVDASIRDVVKTLFEALLIVTAVVFVFLGSLRAVVIPLVAIPLSVVGTFTAMLIFGFSINLLTLLAIVLAIGLVVDDAIIVVENVSRYLEDGMPRMDAALRAARELATPIIAMAIVLVAVYVPIGFLGGLSGALFTEFAFTLVGMVSISAIIALTLSPMMCSRLLKVPREDSHSWQDRLVLALDRTFDWLKERYERMLSGTLQSLPVVMVMAVIVFGAIYYFYSTSKSELAPVEDQGFLMYSAYGNPAATVSMRQIYNQQIFQAFTSFPEMENTFQLNAPGRMFGGMVLKPWDERERTAMEIQQLLQRRVNDIAGLQVATFPPPALPGARGLPIQFVITTTASFSNLLEVSQQFLRDALASGDFMFLQSDLRIDLPQQDIVIDRDMASQLGIDMREIGSSLSAMLGGGYVNFFDFDGRAYKVIPQVQRRYRLNPDQLQTYFLRTRSGAMVPLSTVVHLEQSVQPETINHFQQSNSATIAGTNLPAISQGDALAHLQDLARRTLPAGYSFDYSGPTRQFVQESGGLVLTFFFALVVIFLALAAQFESFRDPVIILISVPMAIVGALLFINLGIGGATLNIYTEVGLVTLIGLISKHGILIVEFANNLQRDGQSKLDAIKQAAGLRLRPILMTTAAMVFGAMPLVLASGAGAVSRFNMGLVIASGLSIGTMFTLFVVPAMYMILAREIEAHKE